MSSDPGGGRSPAEVVVAARKAASRAKREAVLAALDAMLGAGTPVTFTGVARAAGVSHTLAYSPGVREHIEKAIAGQARARRKRADQQTTAASGSLQVDLALAREQNRAPLCHRLYRVPLPGLTCCRRRQARAF